MSEDKKVRKEAVTDGENKPVEKKKRRVHSSRPIDTSSPSESLKGGKERKMDMLEAEERLAQVMNDSPTLVKLGEHGFQITALKPGTQMLIAQEACKIVKVEKANFADVIRQFAMSSESVIKVLTLAILNDRDRIWADEKRQIFSEEYESVYSTIEWETEPKHWMGLLVEVMNLLSMDFFFSVTETIKILREMTLKKKMTIQEQKSSAVALSGVR